MIIYITQLRPYSHPWRKYYVFKFSIRYCRCRRIPHMGMYHMVRMHMKRLILIKISDIIRNSTVK